MEFSNFFESKKIKPEIITDLPLGTGLKSDLEAIDEYLYNNHKPDTTYGSLYVNTLTDSKYIIVGAVDITAKPVLAYFT